MPLSWSRRSHRRHEAREEFPSAPIVLSRAGSVLRHLQKETPAATMQSRSTVDGIARPLLLAEC